MRFDSEEWRYSRHAALHSFLRDEAAVDFFTRLGNFTEVIDDLVDQDKPINTSEFYDAMKFVLCDMPFNQFFKAFDRELRGQMHLALNSWLESDRLRKTGDKTDIAVAFVLRDITHEMLLSAGIWLRGYDAAMDEFPTLRRLLTNDSIEEYTQEQL
jgi:hypothetical protein